MIVRADVNRGAEESLQYTVEGGSQLWQVEIAKYRYKRDTELVIGCSGRHAIIESPKAGSRPACHSRFPRSRLFQGQGTRGR